MIKINNNNKTPQKTANVPKPNNRYHNSICKKQANMLNIHTRPNRGVKI